MGSDYLVRVERNFFEKVILKIEYKERKHSDKDLFAILIKRTAVFKPRSL